MDAGAARRRTTVVAVIVAGAAVAASMLGWRAAGDLSVMHAVHAGLMIYAWGVLLPAGAVIARYFKVTPDQQFPREHDNSFWWNWHRILQSAGIALATLGAVGLWSIGASGLTTQHGKIGTAVLVLGWLQVASGVLRGSKGGPTDRTMCGDHYDMTPRRRIFEAIHKSVGWIVLALADAALATGALLAGGDPLVLLAVGALIVTPYLAIIQFAHNARWVDTYEAIWGHPHVRQDSCEPAETVAPSDPLRSAP